MFLLFSSFDLENTSRYWYNKIFIDLVVTVSKLITTKPKYLYMAK